MRRVLLVSGASSGLGAAIAHHLTARGHRVFGTSRHPKSGVTQPFAMLPLDVTDEASVDACVAAVLQAAGRLDGVVNNAGQGLVGPAEETSAVQAQALFDVNFFGALRLTRAALPHLRASRGRIVNIGSLAGLVGTPGEAVYSATKHALEGYSEALSHELFHFGVRVSLIEPGFFRTGLGEKKQHGEALRPAYDNLRPQILSAFGRALAGGGDPRQVARVVARAIEARYPKLRYRVGQDGVWVPRLVAWVPAPWFRQVIRRRFGFVPAAALPPSA